MQRRASAAAGHNLLKHPLQHTATLCNTLQRTPIHSNKLPHTATTKFHTTQVSMQREARARADTHTASHCNTLHHTPTYFNTLQHTQTHSKNAKFHSTQVSMQRGASAAGSHNPKIVHLQRVEHRHRAEVPHDTHSTGIYVYLYKYM